MMGFNDREITTFNKKHKNALIEEKYWTDLEVHYKKINDEWATTSKQKLKLALLSMKTEQLQELCNCTGLKAEGDDKEAIVEILYADEALAKTLAYLREFQNKKKRAIEIVYEWYHSESEVRYELSPLSKLYHLYSQQRESLFEITTLQKWMIAK